METTTESDSLHSNLDKMSVHSLLTGINEEDYKVPQAVEAVIPAIERLVEAVIARLRQGGRLFYIGAGTSGRLGIVDASECPPTFGVEHGLVVGIIAGGDKAIRFPVEFAEDDEEQGWLDLQSYAITSKDIVVGIAASGRTPYVIGALKKCKAHGIQTGCIVCNKNSEVAAQSDYPVEVIVGPEFVTGSTRMKSGTAQKLVLNMITTTTMIQLGRVKGNKMVDMQLSNAKLVNRGIGMIMQQTGVDHAEANLLLQTHKSVRKAIEYYQQTNS